MDEKKKVKSVESVEQVKILEDVSTSAKSSTTAPIFTLERLRRDCYKLFGITPSTFDAATYGLTGSYTVDGLKKEIQEFQNRQVMPINKGGR